LPDSKNDEPRTIYLSDAALAILSALPRSGKSIFEPLAEERKAFVKNCVLRNSGA
jgi:hypothetical protein